GIELDLLLSRVILEAGRSGTIEAMRSLYGTVYRLEKEVIPDAHTLCALVDGCGKSGRGGLAASLCLRSPLVVNEAWDVALDYRLRVIEEVQQASAAAAQGAIYTVEDANLTGSVADALVHDLQQSTPVAVVGETNGSIHISARNPPGVNLNLGEEMRTLARELGGSGGGHQRRAGATIPLQQRDSCIRRLKEVLAA
ncbi:MAG TPA: DHH family phosphoesterase, partial [Methanomicrobiales archaeon]|nr:DHH family phosphoesterase [Methanomicrobiales archaeon]